MESFVGGLQSEALGRESWVKQWGEELAEKEEEKGSAEEGLDRT
jgi:hypothetical protein